MAMMHTDPPSINPDLAAHVIEGLGQTQKTLSSAWFYDDEGSRLFSQIMAMPEYYLTRVEAHILQVGQEALLRWMTHSNTGHPTPVVLIELGCGNGEKSLPLVHALQQASPLSAYAPMDLSAQALSELQNRFAKALPHFAVHPMLGNYHEAWPSSYSREGQREIVMFIGSNLGNYQATKSIDLLQRIRSKLKLGDGLVLGLDLQKDPCTVLAAYNDRAGLTAAFNLNLLRRLNRELGMDFVLEQFKHYATYSPLDGAARSFLVSTCAQTVRSARLGSQFHFRCGETIYTEQSQKYTEPMIAQMAAQAGFELQHSLSDAQNWYAVCMLQAV